MEKLILTEQWAAGISAIILNDPKTKNAMTEQMGVEFRDTVKKLSQDPGVRVIVLSGAGGVFSAGGHLDMLQAKTKIPQEENQRLMEEFYSMYLSIRDVGVPVIASLPGHAVGAGFCLALACDVRVAVEE